MGFYERAQQRLRAGSQPQVGATLEGLDAEAAAAEQRGFKPWTGPQQIPLEQTSEAGEARWGASADPNSTLLERGIEGGRDALYSGAHGMFTGLGVNPSEFSPSIAASHQMARERSPYAAPVGNIGGEMLSQGVAGVGPVVGGALSGFGNTEGDLEQKARGAVVGGTLGKVGSTLTNKLGALLGRRAANAEREAMERGLIQSGAQRADLKRLDELGGREYFAEGAKRLGLTGRPGRVNNKARELTEGIEAQRAEIVGDMPPDIDPRALGASVRGAAQRYPGITPVANAADRMALDAEGLAARGGAAPWQKVNGQRQYYGDKTNFASGTPEANVRKDVYRAFNDEMGDALSLQNPGSGDKWRQLGNDEQIAIELGDIAGGAVDRARTRDFSFTGAAARALGGIANGPGPAKLSALTQRAGQGLANAFPVGAASGNAAGMIEERADKQVTERALDALHGNQQLLGTYASRIAEAAASPEPGAVNALIVKLIQTDPDFRTQVLPRLRGQQ
jgi:hypothetical protein